MDLKLTPIGNEFELTVLGEGEVGFAQARGGLHLFGNFTRSKKFWVTHLSAVDSLRIRTFIEQHLIEEPFELKLIGNESLRLELKAVLRGTKGKVKAEADAGPGSKIYFYPGDFKVRIERPTVARNTSVTLPVTKARDPNRVRKVFVVDDSGTMRKVLKQTLESHPLLKIAGETGRPTEAEALIREMQPDVITLDIHMPEMDGITLLKRLHQNFDIPVVMISSVSREEGVEILKALELGAVDYIEKPHFDQMQESASQIVEKVLNASDIILTKAPRVAPKLSGTFQSLIHPILIGSSTGGTEALKDVLIALPKEIPPILVVQHIPAVFSEALAKRLNDLCPFEVREAKDGDAVKPGLVLIAPGGLHMTVVGSIRNSTVRISEKPDGYRHKPAVDVLFGSATKVYKNDCTAVILTGMGKDGAIGMKSLRDLGAYTIAQDQATCVVYGMPKAAFELGAVQKQLPLSQIGNHLAKFHGKSKKAA